MMRFLHLLTVLAAMALPSFAQETAPVPPSTDAVATTAEAADTMPDDGVPSEPDQVIVGIYINDIQQLDLQTHSYAMDFYVWLRWTNPDINPALTLEYMNPFQLWGHIPTPLYEEPQVLPDGSLYMAIRYQGQFNSKLPLEKYPFDNQSLLVEFEDNSVGASRQIFVPDTNPVSLNPEMTLPGYILGKPTLTVASAPYPTNFGDTSLTDLEPYSRVTFAVPVHRPTVTYAIKIILPILLIVVCAALVYFIHPSYVEGRIGMGISALLTLVVLQLTTNSQLPEVDYLMMIDILYFIAYIYVVLALAQVVRTTWAAHAEDTARAVAQDKSAFLWSTAAYLLASIGVMVMTLR
jgi:Neurotransmitter-gated ion-channel transmembrane region